MFRHTVMLKWKADAPPDKRLAAIDALRALPREISEIRSYLVAEDAKLDPNNYDAIVIADFNSEREMQIYRNHPRHRFVVAEHLTPNIGS